MKPPQVGVRPFKLIGETVDDCTFTIRFAHDSALSNQATAADLAAVGPENVSATTSPAGRYIATS